MAAQFSAQFREVTSRHVIIKSPHRERLKSKQSMQTLCTVSVCYYGQQMIDLMWFNIAFEKRTQKWRAPDAEQARRQHRRNLLRSHRGRHSIQSNTYCTRFAFFLRCAISDPRPNPTDWTKNFRPSSFNFTLSSVTLERRRQAQTLLRWLHVTDVRSIPLLH